MTDTLLPLWLSIKVASLSTILILLLGLPLALLLSRHRFPGQSLFTGFLTLPLVLPPTVLGYALLLLLGRRGPLGALLVTIFGGVPVFHWTGLVIAATVTAFPLFLLPTRTALESVNPALEDAARLLGRREFAVLVLVTLPLAWRGIAAGLILSFVRCLGDFGASLMVAGNIPGRTRTAAMAIYDAVESGNSTLAIQLSAAISGFAIFALILVQQALPRAEATNS